MVTEPLPPANRIDITLIKDGEKNTISIADQGDPKMHNLGDIYDSLVTILVRLDSTDTRLYWLGRPT
ncbi:hypothetical protein CMI37_27185 [Candidatus Pacearchaeota archaeon]|nr:hypothetical protein [Candidatus Pacearchaeota archaeon]|tara:strand:+ start:467 stop:667 length:201 start_codon:yes stop_codon:yes gene_type:complete